MQRVCLRSESAPRCIYRSSNDLTNGVCNCKGSRVWRSLPRLFPFVASLSFASGFLSRRPFSCGFYDGADRLSHTARPVMDCPSHYVLEPGEINARLRRYILTHR